VRALLERLWALAPRFEAVLYGIEALEILRTEKGFMHIGTDTDGTTLPRRCRLRAGASSAKPRISSAAARCCGRRPAIRIVCNWWRWRLWTDEPALPVGAQIAAAPPPSCSEGHVTSSYWSPELNAPVALAHARARHAAPR
jgi:sarcosine oxidase, subunit alpha